MNMKKYYKYGVIVAVAMVAMMGLNGCVNVGEVVKKATSLVNEREYKGAMKVILELDDDYILKSDTLLQLLSTAYYGESLQPKKRSVAIECYDMDFMPDGKTVAFSDFESRSVNLYSFPDMTFVRTIHMPTIMHGIDINSDGSQFIAAMEDRSVSVFDVEGGEKVKMLTGHTSRVRGVEFKDDSTAYSCSNDKSVAAWDVKGGKSYWKVRNHSMNVKSIRLNKNKTMLIAASNDGTATVLDTEDEGGAEKFHLIHGENYVNDAVISPDDKYAVTVSGDSYLKIWDMNNGSKLHSVFLNEPLTAVDVSADSKYIIVGGARNVFVLDAANGKVVAKIHGTNRVIWTIQFVGEHHFAFVDKSAFWYGELLVGKKLIEEARKIMPVE